MDDAAPLHPGSSLDAAGLAAVLRAMLAHYVPGSRLRVVLGMEQRRHVHGFDLRVHRIPSFAALTADALD
ncbi:MAG: hypothetical protein PHU85_20015 [Phycisphaerae bacterium]|nr:hypothetical protein [Phycisphaerae bacterium]